MFSISARSSLACASALGLLFVLGSGACSGKDSNGSGAGTGAAGGTSNAGSGGTSGTGELCGGAACAVDQICCGPVECGHCISKLSGQTCPASCGGSGGPSAGGAAGHSGSAGASGGGGQSGGAGQGGVAGLSGGAGSGGAMQCTVGGTDCPAGYRCACGGPGTGVCSCHKECTGLSDCDSQNPMCGCTAGNAAPGICVNDCFCTCK
ncbi:MAG TPA: hypothetical protein VGI10_01160 [Polyangiaceae bacterium]|jgi:hypothetical protein